MTPHVPVRRVKATITKEHIKAASWSLYHNPVSLALQEHLSRDACASLFWNSDGFAPKYPEDEARIGIHQEVNDPESGSFLEELHYNLPLPRRATRALWKLRRQGIETFNPFIIQVDLPEAALKRLSLIHI